MHELTKALKETKTPPEIERRLLKRVRTIMRKDRSRIKAGRVTEAEVRRQAEVAAVEELLADTTSDLERL